ncbi:MAG: NifB/NifX family molybdenum-iron cluster-binding protein [Thermodesulfobacteriota bacterium]
MRIAITFLNERISPVFDVARNLLVLDMQEGAVVSERRERFVSDQPPRKAALLAALEVRTLICGAISKPMAGLIGTYGIAIIPFIAGNVQEVIDAYLSGRLPDAAFAMPGCSRPRRMHRGRRRQRAL